jgi:hypothetical protein
MLHPERRFFAATRIRVAIRGGPEVVPGISWLLDDASVLRLNRALVVFLGIASSVSSE